MKYIVIGLGNYGQVLAKELTALNHEVIGVDKNPVNVEMVKESISTSFILDATNEQALSILPLRSVDVVIVAIGEDFGSSVKTVALLKKSHVNMIYARALDKMHKSVLEAFDVDLILTPERDAAHMLVNRIDMHVSVESMQLDKEYCIMKFKTPKSLVGFSVKELALEKEFGLKLISLLSAERQSNCFGIHSSECSVVEAVEEGCKLSGDDYLVCYGKYKDFVAFWRTI